MSLSRRLPQSRGAVLSLAALLLPASAIAADVPVTTVAIPELAGEVAPAPALDTAELDCMAKVVLHEAANQPYDGKVAVAQTLVNRRDAGRFGETICAVANQPGQFFNTAAYNPDRDGQGWTQAMEVARAVLRGDAGPVAPGAMFFRASYAPASSFFRSRQRVASVGAHVFYR